MPLIHHVVTGDGRPPDRVRARLCLRAWRLGCAGGASRPRHQVVAVDLRGHGASPGTAAECSIERYGADVADIMQALALAPAVLVGHSMGCRVVMEAALQAPSHIAGVVLIDGSQFAPAMEATLKASFAAPDGFANLTRNWFRDMFTDEERCDDGDAPSSTAPCACRGRSARRC